MRDRPEESTPEPAEATTESEALLGLVNYWQGLPPHERVRQRGRLQREPLACTDDVYALAVATSDDPSEVSVLAEMRRLGLVVVGRRAVALATERARLRTKPRRV